MLINGQIMLNLTDLRRALNLQKVSPLMFFDNLSGFVAFAGMYRDMDIAVFEDREGGNKSMKKVRHFTINNWLRLLERLNDDTEGKDIGNDAAGSLIGIISDYCCESLVSECNKEKREYELLRDDSTYRKDLSEEARSKEKETRKKVFEIKTGNIEAEAREVKAEAEELKLKEKLDVIFGKRSDLSGKEAVIVLAICELASVSTDAVSLTRSSSKKCADTEEVANLIKELGDQDELILTSRNQPYIFRQYTGDSLCENESIRTVRVKAEPGRNRFLSVKLKLNEQEEFTLANGEYVYCNVIEGKLVKLLPTSSDYGGLTVSRPSLSSDRLETVAGDRHDEYDNLGAVSCIASGGENQGFLALRDGRVIITHSVYNNTQHGMWFRNLVHRVVEIALRNNHYYVLTEKGVVFSDDNNYGTDGRKTGVISL